MGQENVSPLDSALVQGVFGLSPLPVLVTGQMGCVRSDPDPDMPSYKFNL